MLFFPREHFLGKSWCFQNTMEQDGSHSSRCFLQWNSPCLVCWTVHEGTSKMFFYNIILQGGGFPPLLACEWLVPGRQGWKQCCAWCNIFSFLLLLSFLLKSLHFSHNISHSNTSLTIVDKFHMIVTHLSVFTPFYTFHKLLP